MIFILGCSRLTGNTFILSKLAFILFSWDQMLFKLRASVFSITEAIHLGILYPKSFNFRIAISLDGGNKNYSHPL